MRVLVACEFSGMVRDAFAARGHDAWSCDIIETEKPGKHICADVLTVLDQGWDLIIAHPPCTYLANSGVRWLYKNGEVDQDRFAEIKKASEFFRQIALAPVDKICIENPIQHKHAKKTNSCQCRANNSAVDVRTWRNKSNSALVERITTIEAD